MTASTPQPRDARTIESRLDGLIERARDLMEQLTAVSDQQSDAIRSGDVAKIIEIIAQREPLVAQIVDVGEEIGAIVENDELMGVLGREKQGEALRRISTIEHAMKRLRERDGRDQELMVETRDAMARQLAGMGSGKSALRAYSTRSQTPDPIMQDRRG